MSEVDNIALYRRFIEQGVGAGNLDLLEEFLAPDVEIPTVAPNFEPTVEGLRHMNVAFRAGFPDLKAVVEEVFANGEWVAARLTWSGTNTGELFGQAPTHRFARATEIEIIRVRDGRIVDLRQVADVGSLMAQLVG